MILKIEVYIDLQLTTPFNIMTEATAVDEEPQLPPGIATKEQRENAVPFLRRPDDEVYRDACAALSHDALLNNCCISCGCDHPKIQTQMHSIEDQNILIKLGNVLSLTDALKQRIPATVQAQYDLGDYDHRLRGLMLSKYGLYTSDRISLDFKVPPRQTPDLHLCICRTCMDSIDAATKKIPGKSYFYTFSFKYIITII